jgi:undecaprenyl-diphosphatase
MVVAAHPRPLAGEVAYIDALQSLGEPVPWLAEAVRATTGTEGAVVMLAVPAVLAIWRFGRPAALGVAVLLVTMLVLQPLLKEVVDRPRPSPVDVEVRAEHSSESYPSGHSMSTTALYGTAAGLLWVAGRRRWATLAALPVPITFLSAGVQGVHWPSASLGGTALGAAAAALAVNLVTSLTFGVRHRTS